MLEVISEADVIFSKLYAWCLPQTPKTSLFANIFLSFYSWVTEFSYLGHIISNTLVHDSDICREIRNMYTITNMLICKFNKCSTVVKYDF